MANRQVGLATRNAPHTQARQSYLAPWYVSAGRHHLERRQCARDQGALQLEPMGNNAVAAGASAASAD